MDAEGSGERRMQKKKKKDNYQRADGLSATVHDDGGCVDGEQRKMRSSSHGVVFMMGPLSSSLTCQHCLFPCCLILSLFLLHSLSKKRKKDI